MITVLAVSGEELAPTLGGAAEFLLLDEKNEILSRLPCTEKIPGFLKRHQVKRLVCGGIGSCMMDLLSAMGTEVIPGISGTAAEVRDKIRSGTLRPGQSYSCAEHGRTCGNKKLLGLILAFNFL